MGKNLLDIEDLVEQIALDKQELKEKQMYALKSLEHLKQVLQQHESSFILQGLLLKEAKQYYFNIPEKEYKDIYDFAKQEFDLGKTTTKLLIQVNDRFANGQHLKEKYKQYKYTQLVEMVSMTDEQLEFVNPKMTVAELKAFKKTNQTQEDSILNEYIKEPTSFVETFFKNKEDREKFLNTYREWELWKEVPELTLKFFRIQLTDETYLIATESEYNCSQYYGEYYSGDKTKTEKEVKYTILNPKDKYSRYLIGGMSKTTIINHLSNNKLGYFKIITNE